jgi:3D-(3,5/4)-trihydroxycyclohexane-1,2-dione acylhydrolase (decyclizing)
MTTIRLTMAQALIRYLAAQTSEVDGREVPLFAGVFAIFPSVVFPLVLVKF